jgi:hypothetical protein
MCYNYIKSIKNRPVPNQHDLREVRHGEIKRQGPPGEEKTQEIQEIQKRGDATFSFKEDQRVRLAKFADFRASRPGAGLGNAAT